jgi:hypothetical protein
MPISDLTPERILRSSGPSFRDAIETVREAGFAAEEFSYGVEAERWFLLRGREVSLIGLKMQSSPSCFVWLSSSPTIYARDTGGTRHAYPAHLFNNAIGDQDGNITLEDGSHLHACEVERFSFPNWGPKETRVISIAIEFMRAQESCYRMLGRRDPEDPNSLELVQATPDAPHLYIDYHALPSMEVEKFDAFLFYYRKRTPKEKCLSRQTIARILSDAGMRIAQRKAAA